MIALPPEDGALHESPTCPLPAVAERLLGVPGVVDGVALAVLDVDPVPTVFVAETRKSYSDPLVSEVTVVEVAVDVPSANVVQVDVAASLYSIT